MTELIAAGIGALLGYLLGWAEQRRVERRRRLSVASACLSQVLWVARSLVDLRSRWKRGSADLVFPDQVLQQFPAHLELFRAETSVAVLELTSALRDIEKGLDVAAAAPEEQQARLRREIVAITEGAIAKAFVAKEALLKDGARHLSLADLPTEAAIAAFESEVTAPYAEFMVEIGSRRDRRGNT